jgi:hypothetical protein
MAPKRNRTLNYHTQRRKKLRKQFKKDEMDKLMEAYHKMLEMANIHIEVVTGSIARSRHDGQVT